MRQTNECGIWNMEGGMWNVLREILCFGYPRFDVFVLTFIFLIHSFIPQSVLLSTLPKPVLHTV
jgi:hypothetical protein